MKIISATKKHSKEISKVMLAELANPSQKFPMNMIAQYRVHAQEENIIKEFDNPHLMAFLVIDNGEINGFIVGYEEKSNNATVIHYIAGNNIEIKKLLLKKFITECKKRKIECIKADSFEFMENDKLFKEENFTLVKKERITGDLELLWYELRT